MRDREVKVTLTMKAYQVETTRAWFALAGEFPMIAYGYALKIKKLLSKDGAAPEDGAELARLVEGLNDDAQRADMVRTAIAALLDTAIISDPDGRKGPLQ